MKSPGRGPVPMEWIKRYEIRPFVGAIPRVWDGGGDNSLSRLWLRDNPPRPLDFCLAGGFGRCVFRASLCAGLPWCPSVPSASVYFHASEADLRASGDGYLLGQARAKAFRNGYFDQTGLLWNQAGRVLATTHQVVYYKN